MVLNVTELDEYIMLLDQRREKRGQRDASGLVAKKNRTVGAPSASKPPSHAPSWAVQKEGMLALP